VDWGSSARQTYARSVRRQPAGGYNHLDRSFGSNSMSRRILRSSPGPMSWPLCTGMVVRLPSGCSNCQWLPFDLRRSRKPIRSSARINCRGLTMEILADSRRDLYSLDADDLWLRWNRSPRSFIRRGTERSRS